MKTREVLLLSDKTLTDSGTETINIDINDPITGFYVQLRATNGATSNDASPLHKCISKIEFVDGGNTLWSMPGLLQRGFVAHLTKVTPHGKISEIGGDSQYSNIPIYFGRHKYDMLYAFNPQAFLNPQLKITYNLATVNAVGATGFVTATGRLTVHAHVMEDVPAPVGMLVNKEYESFTTAASGDYVSELPVDRVWRALIVRAYESGVALNTSLSNLKLSFDAGKYIPFDMSIPKFWRMMVSEFGVINSEGLAQVDDAAAFQNWLAHVIGGNVNGRTASHIVTADNGDNSQTTVNIQDDAGSTQTDAGVFWSYRGTSLENCVVHPFGVLGDPDTWLRASEFRNGKLYLTQGNAGATANVALQEVFNY
jgi:hypothetical protein